jgi:hypothetical protein
MASTCLICNLVFELIRRLIRHEDILIPLIDNYEKDGTYSKDFAEEARKNAKAHHDGKQVGKILLRVLGVATD